MYVGDILTFSCPRHVVRIQVEHRITETKVRRSLWVFSLIKLSTDLVNIWNEVL